MPGSDGVMEPTRWLRYGANVGIHAGVRALGPFTLTAMDSPAQEPNVHWRKTEINQLTPGSMCLLVLLFDRYHWEGEQLAEWFDTFRRFYVWLTRPDIELQPDDPQVTPGVGGAGNRTMLYLKQPTEGFSVDGELGLVGFPDMMQLFYLGDFAVLGFRPGLETIQLMIAQGSGERTAPDEDFATTEHHAYVIELKPTPTDMVRTWDPRWESWSW